MKRTPSRLFVAGLTATALLGAACGTGEPDAAAPASDSTTSVDTAPAGDAAVGIKDFTFDPTELRVSAGTTVTWTNDDFFGHTVTSGEPGAPTDAFDGVLGEVAQAEGMNFSFTFDEPGTYAYFCRFHPRMLGSVTVTG